MNLNCNDLILLYQCFPWETTGRLPLKTIQKSCCAGETSATRSAIRSITSGARMNGRFACCREYSLGLLCVQPSSWPLS